MSNNSIGSVNPTSHSFSYNEAVRNNPLNQLAEPLVDDFVEFTDKIENPQGSLLERLAVGAARQFELVGGLVRIGNTIEEDRSRGDATYQNSKYEIGRYASSQTVGVALGGLGLVVGGIVLGPVGLLTGAVGYWAGSKLGGNAFDYIVSKLSN